MAGRGQTGPVTATVMFTDTVASTELLSRLGGDRARDLQIVHDRLLQSAVDAGNGRVVKSVGDGLVATFESAREAISAAIGIQRAVDAHAARDPELAFRVRIGISSGDVVWIENGADCFGTAVVEAKRLCDSAGGKEILVSDIVRLLARDGGAAFEGVGTIELKGLAEPLAASRVLWSPGAAGLVPIPPALRMVDESTPAFVGRGDLLDRLRHAWAGVRNGGCHAVLLAGEPGVGKTRTAAHIASEVWTEGAIALYGGCQEGLSPPYQPFVEALDHHTSNLRDPDLGKLPGELRRLLPELDSRIPGLPEPVTSDPRTEEYRLFEAIGSWLASASSAPGLLIVLDDLHWAGKPTLLALGHLIDVAAEHPGARLLVIGTYRDVDVDRSHPLGTLLAKLASRGTGDRYTLTGLSAGEVVELVEASAGHELDEQGGALALKVHAETEGNPFFVGEVLRHLVETGVVKEKRSRWVIGDIDEVAVPPSVRDVVRRRLSYLPDTANAVLTRAAVLGREFDLPVLLALDEKTEEDDVVDAIERAVAARLLEEVSADRFRFAHALVQETIYDELTETRRQRIHRRVVRALEQHRPDDVTALANHSEASGVDGVDRGRALGYLIAAARHSQAARALADAESRFRRALTIAGDDETYADLVVDALIGLGECQRDQGDPEYRTTLIDAAHRAGDDLPRLLAALLANRRAITSIVGETDEDRVALAMGALDRLGPDDSADRARLLAYLASEIVFVGEPERRLALVDEAEAIARRIGDRHLLAEVLIRTAFPAIALDRIDALVSRGREAVELADEIGDPTMQIEARSMRAWAQLTSGEVRAAAETNREAAEIAADAGSSTLRWMTRYYVAAHVGAAGNFLEANATNDALLEVAQNTGEPDGLNWWGAARTALGLLQGNVAELADVIGQYADAYPALPTWRAAHVEALAEGGRLDEARQVLREHDVDVSVLSQDPYGLVGLASFAHAAWRVGDADLGRRVRDIIEPHARRWSHLFIGITGPMSLALGRALLAMGNVDEGIAQLRAAIADAEAQGCPAVATRTRIDLAEALAMRGNDSDLTEAGDVINVAMLQASEWGADGLVALATRVEAALVGAVR